MKVAFLVNDLQLSGGIGVVVEHARHLGHDQGWDVTLVLVREQEQPSWSYRRLPDVRVASLAEARDDHYDVAVATWWETTFSLFELSADRYAYFVQSLEDRFYRPDEAERFGAAITLDLPVAFITEARWIAETLAQLRPEAQCYLVRNGIDKTVFASPPEPSLRWDEPLRILIEGYPDTWFKGVGQALVAADQMHRPHHVTLVTPEQANFAHLAADEIVGPLSHAEMASLYARTHVVLKLSRVEGMFGPPLEGFHMGATAVVSEVTGHDEYVEHGFNALVCGWDDPHGTARELDLLASDPRLLHYLRCNALATARGWPSWEQAGQFMAVALRSIRRASAPSGEAGARQLLADLRAAVDAHGSHLQERNELVREVQPVRRIKRLPGAQRLWQARARRPVRVARRIGRAVVRRARGRLPGL